MLVASFIAAGTAKATIIQVEFTATIHSDAPNNNWLGEGPLPSSMTGSFELDTSVYASSTFSFETGYIAMGGNSYYSSEPILTGFGVTGLRRSNARLYADGNLILEALAPADVFAWGHNGDDNLYSGNGTFPLFGSISSDFGMFPAWVTQEEIFNSQDPLALLLTRWQPGSPFRSTGPWGVLSGSVTVNAHPVPEPGTLGLAALALAFMGLHRRRAPRGA
jgi:hypothetical protein